MRLSRDKSLGRYRHKETGREFNVKTGRQIGRSVDVMFYLYRNKRQILSDREFYH